MNVFKMYKVSCILMNMLCPFYGNHLAMFSTWRLKTFSPPFALLWALMNEALVARALHAACRARSECRLSRAIFHSHRTNAPGSRSQSKRSGIELELRTLRDRARRAIDPPTASAIVGYRATSSILVIHDPDLSERIDTVLQKSISICLPVHSIFVLRIVEKLSEFFNENWPSSRARRKNNQIELLLVLDQFDITRQMSPICARRSSMIIICLRVSFSFSLGVETVSGCVGGAAIV